MRLSRRAKQSIAAWAAGTVVLGGMLALMVSAGWLGGVNRTLTNALYWSPENRASERIVIVAIDDATLETRAMSELGTLQLPKADYAQVIENLAGAGAEAIGVDVILSEESTDADVAALAETLAAHRQVVIAAEPAGRGRPGLLPLPELRRDNLASVAFVPDRDNIVRRQASGFADERVGVPFSIALVNRYLGQTEDANRREDGRYVVSEQAVRAGEVRVEPIAVPLDAGGRFLINYFGPPRAFESVSFADAAEGRFVSRETGEPVDMSGKIALIGEIGTALHDEQFTPVSFGEPMPGVEIHAHAVQTMLSGRFLRESSAQATAWLSAAALAAALAAFLIVSTPLAFAGLAFGWIAYGLAAYFAFEYGLILDLVYPPLALALAFAAAYVFRYLTQARIAKQTKLAFGRYVSPHVVHEIVENPQAFKLGGQKKELTVLFTDIAGFTSISEQLDPSELVEQLNEYLDEMSGVILAHDGTIDKYIGDAVMAFWNAPLPQEDHAARACRAALAYADALEKLNAERAERGQMPFYARIGINTGEMVVGNMGSSQRFDYTVIGDAVNLGARLESANKAYGTRILISERTYRQAREAVEARELDLIAVKGKSEPVRIYELLAERGKASEEDEKVRGLFSLGLEAYRDKDWDKAERHFADVLAVREDGPSKAYLERVRELRGADLPEDWDGVFVAKSK